FLHIQDPAGVQLYTRTGELTKGGVVLPYRCARGSTSLELFHLYLNRFIPGTSASGCHFQMFLLEGLTRWNEDRAQVAAGAQKTGKKCYAGQKQHCLYQLTQRLQTYSKPLLYTAELIGMSYLYAQTGRELQMFPDDPDGKTEESCLLEDIEGLMQEEAMTDLYLETINKFQVSEVLGSTSSPAMQPVPTSGWLLSTYARKTFSRMEQLVVVGPDGTPGYQHVVHLSELVELCRKGYVSNAEAEEIVGLWQNLLEVDKGSVAYPSRYKDSLMKGR
uniref:Uncharacterized protein n=1 Tax=Poecilia formosa TaxID=48698 RepID=A0A096MGP9_POEFO